MARKTTGSSTPRTNSRSKKIATLAETAAVQAVAIVQAVPEVEKTETRRPEIRKNVTPANASQMATSDLNEEIRRRAYELFLERKGAPGDPARDWMLAEHEVRARHPASKGIALAASQGRS